MREVSNTREESVKIILSIAIVAGLSIITACNKASSGGGSAPGPQPDQGPELSIIPFAVTVNGEDVRCGNTYEGVGVSRSDIEIKDLRFYVHDVHLVRGDGSMEPFVLEDDGLWQSRGVALLDFAGTESEACADRGTAAVRTGIRGVRPDGEFTGIAFKVGVPPELNHLNSPSMEPPFNQPGMWWSWKSGFRHMKVDLVATTGEVVKERFTFHSGANSCTADQVAGPYTCKSELTPAVDLSFSEGQAVELDLARLLGDLDLSIGRGCMGTSSLTDPNDPPGKTSDTCGIISATLGLVIDDQSGKVVPPQVAFRSVAAAAVGKLADPADVDFNDVTDPAVWPRRDYQRNPGLDGEARSMEGLTDSHPPGDARYGANCLSCHQDNGPGQGKYILGGTLQWEDGAPYDGGGVVELGTGEGRFGAPLDVKLKNFIALDAFAIDANGQFYGTSSDTLDYSNADYQARVVDRNGVVRSAMAPKKVGACNTCHNGSFTIRIPRKVPGE